MHFGKAVGEVTHQEWVSYFQYALDYHSPDYGDLVEKIKTSVVLDESDLDIDICFDKWVLAYWELFQRNHMMSFHEKHPKIAVEALSHGHRPASFRHLIQNHLKLDHKFLRNSVLQFFDFVKSKLESRLELARAGNPAGLVITNDNGDAPPADNPTRQQGLASAKQTHPCCQTTCPGRGAAVGKGWYSTILLAVTKLIILQMFFHVFL